MNLHNLLTCSLTVVILHLGQILGGGDFNGGNRASVSRFFENIFLSSEMKNVEDDSQQGHDDFVLENVIGSREAQSQSASTIQNRFRDQELLMKMIWMIKPKGQEQHRIKFYSSSSRKVENLKHSKAAENLFKTTSKGPKPVRSEAQVFPAFDDPETVANFAKMTSNAYFARAFTGWRNVTDYDTIDGFGWDEPGLRGYIFVNRARNIVIVSFKGTSILLAGGDTVTRDKDQDNKMFSCCCGRVDISWIPVCGCYSGGYLGRAQTCSNQCLKDALRSDPDSYFLQAQAIVDQLRQIYPTARLWFTGHSLGGAVANLMALANEGTSSVSFEAPGEALYAQRIGLLPEAEDGDEKALPIWNFGVTSDPIYMGRCNGVTSSCYLVGYALETGCRTGHDCTWQWEGREDVGTHRIDWVIDNVIMSDPPTPHPICVPVRNCKDCTSWSFTE